MVELARFDIGTDQELEEVVENCPGKEPVVDNTGIALHRFADRKTVADYCFDYYYFA